MRRKGKAIALAATTFGLAVLVGAGIAAKDQSSPSLPFHVRTL